MKNFMMKKVMSDEVCAAAMTHSSQREPDRYLLALSDTCWPVPPHGRDGSRLSRDSCSNSWSGWLGYQQGGNANHACPDSSAARDQGQDEGIKTEDDVPEYDGARNEGV